ncbi:MAG: hypothetical protein DI613_02575 [Kocuria rhizophila]|nr:MAG: hypothetical protein DI613_02575 [Kocuria rhizophila]
MSPETNTQTRAGLFAGKARTVAAVAAFSGLALATTVSVQATQNASDETPAAVVAEAPAAEQTVTAEPAAKSDSSKAEKAEKKEEKAAPKAEAPKAEAAPAVVEAVPASQVAPAPEAPKAEVAPAAQAPAAEAASIKVAPASKNVAPVAPAAQAPAAQAPAAEAPVAQGRHAAPANADTQAREAAAAQEAGVAYQAPAAPVVTPASNNNAPAAQAPAAPAPAAEASKPAAPAAPAAPAEKPATVAPQSSNASASGKGQAILSAAEGQIGVTQDCTMLVTNSLKAVGINHHGWPESYKSLGTQVSASEAKAGDIAYYANGGSGFAHVAIYAGDGQAIHGGWNGNQTVKQSVNVGSGPEFIRVG